MARVLIVGCGARGCALAERLIAAGHTVRGTSREPARVRAIAAVGAEAVEADPDRVATLVAAFDGVAVACLLLGSATGAAAGVAALHGTRLDMLLAKLTDTTVRGVFYEGAGTVPAGLLAAGARLVRAHCETFRTPYVVTTEPVRCEATSLSATVAQIEGLLVG